MKTTMGNSDRIIRVILALVISVLYFTIGITGTAGIILLVVSGVFLLTSLIGFCPLYRLLGISTNRKPEKSIQ